MIGLSPDIVEPDVVTEVVAITAMYAGTVAGGFELLPVDVLKPVPQTGSAGMAAKPLKLEGALGRLIVAHCDPQNVTALPTPAAFLPITNEPPPDGCAKTSTLVLADVARE